MAKKNTVREIPIKWYEGEDPTDEELALYGEVIKSIAVSQNALMQKPGQVFIANVLLNLGVVLDLTIDTAATDFRNIYVNPKFWILLDKDERLFVLAHETWHVAMNHYLRRQGRDPELWNIACDLEIHFILINEALKEPWCLQHDPAWSKYSAESIYEELLKTQKKRRGGSHGGNPGGSGSQPGSQPGGSGSQPGNQPGNQPGGSGLPDENGKPNDKFGSTDRPFDKVIYDDDPGSQSDDGNGEGPGYGPGGSSKKIIRKGDWKDASKEAENTGDYVRRIIQRAVIIASKSNGVVPGAVTGIIDEINNPVIPWREQLSHWTKTVTSESGRRTYARLNRRSWVYKVILPTRKTKTIKVVVAFDTSGSCGPELQQFFNELIGIMESYDKYDLTLIQCDARIQKVTKYSSDKPYDPAEGFQAYGFGGTDFRPVFDYIEENELNPTALIYLTDGYGPAPDEEPSYPVLWVITEGGERPCKWGDAVSLTNDRVK